MKALRIPVVIVLMVITGQTFNAGAQTETNLHSFVDSPKDGKYPQAGLVQGSDGNFYGTTLYGGTIHSGTVFRISSSGSFSNLYSFSGYPTDGADPYAQLVQGRDGNFYGTTYLGGTNDDGTVFRISPGGTCTNLHSFVGYPTEGANPYAGLVQGSDGNLYGTTSYGDTVFRISTNGTYATLYYFGGQPSDGSDVFAGLVQGSDGNLYGTTVSGGTNSCRCGIVFRISLSGSYTSLYSFGSSPTDGSEPYAGLVQGSDGNFYGTTLYGGTSTNIFPGGFGTVFRISPSGSYTSLYSFGSSPTDGHLPYARLVQGSDGNFYGTTSTAGGQGTVFRISSSGSYTTLYSFAGSPIDGANPYAGLVQGSDGSFYGTTQFGGTNDLGTVFKLTVPLNPPPYPINKITGVHVAATNIIFSIPSIAGETYQLQFSNSMKPTNWVNVTGVSMTNSIGALLTQTNFGGAVGPQGFYRFAISP